MATSRASSSSSKWPSGSRRRVSEGDSSRRGKTVLGVDESVDLGASCGGIRPQHQQGAPPQASVVPPPCSPIDVEAIDDDVQLLPSSTSSTTFPQGRNRPRTRRRNHPVTVVLDEDSDVQIGSSAMSDEPETVNNNREKSPPKRPLINCEVYEHYKNVECSYKSKRKCVTDNPELKKAALKEPAFTCAICLGHMTEETSTVCGHIFCHACIKTAVQTQRKCPTCRKSLTVKNIHRVYLPTAQ